MLQAWTLPLGISPSNAGAVENPPPPHKSPIWFAAPLVGKTDTALRAAASQNLAAVGSAHSLAKPVLLGALTLLGLIGTNHLVHLPFVLPAVHPRGAPPTTTIDPQSRLTTFTPLHKKYL